MEAVTVSKSFLMAAKMMTIVLLFIVIQGPRRY